jgi:DNA mismatch endonuclease (patch repair protein)
LPGTPDVTFQRERVCVFVDGCFWHGCPRCYRAPKTNPVFWDAKRRRNRAHDRLMTAALRQRGWAVIRIWEHCLTNPGAVVKRIERMLAKNQTSSRTETSERHE